jgi:hypothetical protein
MYIKSYYKTAFLNRWKGTKQGTINKEKRKEKKEKLRIA